MKDNQELQILKEAVNMALGGNIGFEDKENIIKCFRNVELQLQSFDELEEKANEIKDAYNRLSIQHEQLKANQIQVENPQVLEGKPKKVLTK